MYILLFVNTSVRHTHMCMRLCIHMHYLLNPVMSYNVLVETASKRKQKSHLLETFKNLSNSVIFKTASHQFYVDVYIYICVRNVCMCMRLYVHISVRVNVIMHPMCWCVSVYINLHADIRMNICAFMCKCVCVWFGMVLWHINHFRLFMANIIIIIIMSCW